jgi:hypothetical protein
MKTHSIRIEAYTHDGQKLSNLRIGVDGYHDLVERDMREELAIHGVTPRNAKSYTITYTEEKSNVEA